ncbi:hemerythrin domain-containing protein [Sorangium sp. So ce1000]|uniref:hemerythrin domain-containing protein n=1 Tax=Sorangium sp. So ce1000 TaxID=3133325 RepID=UPI003F5EF444
MAKPTCPAASSRRAPLDPPRDLDYDGPHVMELDRMVSELFHEEEVARDTAKKLIELAQRSADEASAERASLLAFLRGPMERHMRYEETAIFPHFQARGLAEEVQVALKHHAAVREAADALASVAQGGDVARVIVDVARLLLHHTNFEGDYIYPELTHDEWRELMKETVLQGI